MVGDEAGEYCRDEYSLILEPVDVPFIPSKESTLDTSKGVSSNSYVSRLYSFHGLNVTITGFGSQPALSASNSTHMVDEKTLLDNAIKRIKKCYHQIFRWLT